MFSRNIIWKQVAARVLFIAMLVGLTSTLAMGLEEDAPVSDPKLEARLVRTADYTTKEGDTLRSIAGVLYGHKTWWSKIVSMNPQFKGKKPDEPLIVGEKLQYQAAVVGEDYVVQPGDWLIRIVEWRYGSADFLAALYKKNPWIKNPNRIYPGQKVLLLADGTIKNSKSGEVLLRGTREEVEAPSMKALQSTQAAKPPAGSVEKKLNEIQTSERAIAAVKNQTPREFEVSSFLSDNRFLFFGFVIGFLFLALLLSQYQRWARNSAHAETSMSPSGLGQGFGFKKWASKKEAPTRQGSEPQLTARTSMPGVLTTAKPARNLSAVGIAQKTPAVNRDSETSGPEAAPVTAAEAEVKIGGGSEIAAESPVPTLTTKSKGPAASIESTPGPVQIKKRPPLKVVSPEGQGQALGQSPSQLRGRQSPQDFIQSGRGPYNAGERSATMHYHFDPKWVGNTATEIERRPGYLSLLRNFRKRYIK